MSCFEYGPKTLLQRKLCSQILDKCSTKFTSLFNSCSNIYSCKKFYSWGSWLSWHFSILLLLIVLSIFHSVKMWGKTDEETSFASCRGDALKLFFCCNKLERLSLRRIVVSSLMYSARLGDRQLLLAVWH